MLTTFTALCNQSPGLFSSVKLKLCTPQKKFWRRKWQPTLVFLPGESHGQRSLADCSPWGHKESDTTERLNWITAIDTLYSTISFWNNNDYGKPIQYGENPRASVVNYYNRLLHSPTTSGHWTEVWNGNKFREQKNKTAFGAHTPSDSNPTLPCCLSFSPISLKHRISFQQ